MQVHQREYVEQFIAGTLPTAALRRIGFPWSEALVERTLHSVAGTTLTASLAINQGIALHLTGATITPITILAAAIVFSTTLSSRPEMPSRASKYTRY